MAWDGVEHRKHNIDTNPRYLEPRVIRVETELESLTKDIASLTVNIKDLSSAVSRQSENVEKQFQSLAVAVTTAGAPRKTDWGVIVAAVGMVFMAGAATLSPLYLRMNDVQVSAFRSMQRMDDHEKLVMHPVGLSRVDALEKSLRERASENSDDIRALDSKLQKETELTANKIEQRVSDLDIRLQREFLTAQQTIRDTATAVETRSRQTSDSIQKELEELRTNGSAGTRERLAVLEYVAGLKNGR